MPTETCKHCGEQSPQEEFCCGGCRMAYELITGAGLGAVYSQADRRWKKPDGIPAPEFLLFDNIEFLNSRAPIQNDGTRRIELSIGGLMCSACIWVVERLPHFIPEIIESRVDYGQSRIQIQFADTPHTLSRAAETLARLGYRLNPNDLDLSEARIPRTEWIRLGVSGLSAAGAMHIGLVLIGAHRVGIDAADARAVGLFAGVAALPALTFGAWPFYRSAIHNLRLKYLSADLLVTLAVALGTGMSIANGIHGKTESYFDALSMVIFLLLTGRILVKLSTLKTVDRPLWLARRNGRLISAELLKLGDRFHMQSGDLCPVDARLLSRQAWFDESSITGENFPVSRVEGQKIFQGAMTTGSAELEVLATVTNSSLSQLMKYIRTQRWQSLPPLYEGILTLTIVLMSAGVLLLGGTDKVAQAIALFVVTCPCALQLARPLSLANFRRECLKNGLLLFRPDRVLEWANIRSIYFDKTGTLTSGKLSLTDIKVVSASGLSERDLYSIAYQLSVTSEHPLSRAVAAAMNDRPRTKTLVNEIVEVPGFGVRGQFQGTPVTLQKSSSIVADAGPLTSLYINNVEVLQFVFSDPPREDASTTLRMLSENGFSCHLLSGDRLSECESFAKNIAFDFKSIRGAHNSSQKREILLSEATAGFVGDGLNDALAMQASMTSLGFTGSAEANLQSADAYLLKRDLSTIPKLIAASKRTRRIIFMSLTLSLVYNAICIGLVLAGFLGPIICAIFMPLSSLTVIALANQRTWAENQLE